MCSGGAHLSFSAHAKYASHLMYGAYRCGESGRSVTMFAPWIDAIALMRVGSFAAAAITKGPLMQ
jgi:hypothetical protein